MIMWDVFSITSKKIDCRDAHNGGLPCAHLLSFVSLILSLAYIFDVGGIENVLWDAQILGQEYPLPGVGTQHLMIQEKLIFLVVSKTQSWPQNRL